jgi:hypothetical protein
LRNRHWHWLRSGTCHLSPENGDLRIKYITPRIIENVYALAVVTIKLALHQPDAKSCRIGLRIILRWKIWNGYFDSPAWTTLESTDRGIENCRQVCAHGFNFYGDIDVPKLKRSDGRMPVCLLCFAIRSKARNSHCLSAPARTVVGQCLCCPRKAARKWENAFLRIAPAVGLVAHRARGFMRQAIPARPHAACPAPRYCQVKNGCWRKEAPAVNEVC